MCCGIRCCMAVYHEKLFVSSKGENDIINITGKVQSIIENSKLKEGICLVFVAGATGTLSTIEYEDGLLYDFPKALEKFAPKNQEYRHHLTWNDDNGRSHVKATLMGSSLIVPFQNFKIVHGTWQQLIFMELDTKGRTRELVVQLVGE
jgi:secondary thiamine-phosphate synthase enzyme